MTQKTEAKTEAKTAPKIKVKLLEPVTINDQPHVAGDVVEVGELTAEWLIGNKSAESIGDKADKPTAKAKG